MAIDGATNSRNAGVDDDPIPESGGAAVADASSGAHFCSCASCRAGSEVRLGPSAPNLIARYVSGASLATIWGTATPEQEIIQLRREVNDMWWAVAGFAAVVTFLIIAFRVRH